jgi:hypothetical protein
MSGLEIWANIASIATAIVAGGAAVAYWRDGCKKQKRLEDYLRQEKLDNSERRIHSVLHLMSALGMTEAEIFKASFSSQHIVSKIRPNPDTGLAEYILFEYSEAPKKK